MPSKRKRYCNQWAPGQHIRSEAPWLALPRKLHIHSLPVKHVKQQCPTPSKQAFSDKATKEAAKVCHLPCGECVLGQQSWITTLTHRDKFTVGLHYSQVTIYYCTVYQRRRGNAFDQNRLAKFTVKLLKRFDLSLQCARGCCFDDQWASSFIPKPFATLDIILSKTAPKYSSPTTAHWQSGDPSPVQSLLLQPEVPLRFIKWHESATQSLSIVNSPHHSC